MLKRLQEKNKIFFSILEITIVITAIFLVSFAINRMLQNYQQQLKMQEENKYLERILFLLAKFVKTKEALPSPLEKKIDDFWEEGLLPVDDIDAPKKFRNKIFYKVKRILTVTDGEFLQKEVDDDEEIIALEFERTVKKVSFLDFKIFYLRFVNKNPRDTVFFKIKEVKKAKEREKIIEKNEVRKGITIKKNR